jgi:hypothetical protein
VGIIARKSDFGAVEQQHFEGTCGGEIVQSRARKRRGEYGRGNGNRQQTGDCRNVLSFAAKPADNPYKAIRN